MLFYRGGVLRQRGSDPKRKTSIPVYRGGVLRQKGAGRLQGLFDYVKRSASNAWQAGKKALQNNFLNTDTLGELGQAAINVMSGKKSVGAGLKQVLKNTLKPRLQKTLSDVLLNGSQTPIKRKRKSPNVSSQNKRHRPDIFDNGFHA